MQTKVVDALFEANFSEGRNVGDRDTLLAIAGESGLDRAVIAALFASDADREAVQQEIAMAREMGVTGVPASSSTSATPSWARRRSMSSPTRAARHCRHENRVRPQLIAKAAQDKPVAQAAGFVTSVRL